VRRPFPLLVFLPALNLLAVTGGRVVEPPAAPFLVIVHSSNAETSLTKSELSHLLLKKLTKWKDGRSVVPIDLVEGSLVRRSFSRAVHGRDVPAIKNYWQQQIFSGRGVPPREIDFEDEVVRLVARTPGAIGYVSTATPLKDVKKIRIEE
jgi:ABC-type phosphate transport system substrate-binding protein